MKRIRGGFSAIELLIVLSVLGILLAAGFTQLRPPAPRLFANDMRAMVQQARYEAIRRNRPVAVVWEGEASRFITRVDGTNPSVTAACSGATELVTKRVADYPRLTVNTELAAGNGLVWLPNGQARKCDGTALEAVSTTITDGRTTRVVTVSLTGRVSVQ